MICRNTRGGRVGLVLWSREVGRLWLGWNEVKRGGGRTFQAGDKTHKTQCVTVLE